MYSETRKILHVIISLLVLEFKSEYDYIAREQIRDYNNILCPYYYGIVYGEYLPCRKIKVEIYRDKGKLVLSGEAEIAHPYLMDFKPIIESYKPFKSLTFSYLCTSKRSICSLTVNLNGRKDTKGESQLDEKGNHYANHDYRLVIDCPAKLTRLVVGDPVNRLE
ncbi:MAG: hypothetical protein ACP5NQ_07255 [Vulcanisaeta sp.]